MLEQLEQVNNAIDAFVAGKRPYPIKWGTGRKCTKCGYTYPAHGPYTQNGKLVYTHEFTEEEQPCTSQAAPTTYSHSSSPSQHPASSEPSLMGTTGSSPSSPTSS